MSDHEAYQESPRQSKPLSKMEVLKMIAHNLSLIRFSEVLRGIEEVYFSNPPKYGRTRAGFINTHGEWVFNSNNVMTSSKFSCGFYCEQRRASALFFGKTGNDAFGKTFRWAEAFSEDLEPVNLGYGRARNCLHQGLDQYLYAGVADEWALRHMLTSRGQRHGETVHHSQFSDGMLKIFVDGKYGYLDRTGDVAIPMRFYSAGGFREGLASVYIDPTPPPSTAPEARAQWASHPPFFIDRNGEVAFQLGPGDSARSFSDGLALVRGVISGRRFINKLGVTAFKLRNDIDQIGEFNDGVAPAAISMTTLWVPRD